MFSKTTIQDRVMYAIKSKIKEAQDKLTTDTAAIDADYVETIKVLNEEKEAKKKTLEDDLVMSILEKIM